MNYKQGSRGYKLTEEVLNIMPDRQIHTCAEGSQTSTEVPLTSLASAKSTSELCAMNSVTK